MEATNFLQNPSLELMYALPATFIGDCKQLQLTFGAEQHTDEAKNPKI